MGDSVLGLLQFGWNALFKGHVLVGLYKGECLMSFQTLRLNVSTSDTKMHVSAFWVYYSLGGMPFFKGHVLVGLYKGECFRSFQTLR